MNPPLVFDKLKLIHQLVAITTFFLGIACLLAFPSKAVLADGYKTPIIALEFASQLSDLTFLTSSDELSQKHRNEMDNGHRVDMLFLVSYSLLLVLSVAAASIKASVTLSISLSLSLLIIPFDIYENLVLMDITEKYDQPGTLEQLLDSLQLWTTLKWSCIGGCLSTIGIVYFFDLKKIILGGFFIASGGGVLLGTLVINHSLIHELMSGTVGLSFLVLILIPLISE